MCGVHGAMRHNGRIFVDVREHRGACCAEQGASDSHRCDANPSLSVHVVEIVTPQMNITLNRLMPSRMSRKLKRAGLLLFLGQADLTKPFVQVRTRSRRRVDGLLSVFDTLRQGGEAH